MRHRILLAVLVLLNCSACIPISERNLDLGTTRHRANESLRRMRENPKALARPVVVLNGYHGLPTLANRITRKLRAATSNDRSDFLTVSYLFGTNIDSMTDDVIREVESRWPGDDPDQTIEVDVVAISMGGLIARWGALAPSERSRAGKEPEPRVSAAPQKRLRIHRLFTLGSPHRGASLADWIRVDSASTDLQAGSSFLATLDAHFASRDYQLICYAQLRDLICGATRCAPPNTIPIWTSGTFFFSHLDLADNPVFLADIAAYLRDETPRLVPADIPPTD